MERVGKYAIIERIGKGAMGVVYRARDESLGEVAVKLMSADLGADSVAHQRFLREARVAAGLTHPNIVDIHGMGEHEGRPYIVMEMLAGRSLQAIIRRGDEISLEERLEWMKQVAAALAYAHGAGVTHRDIKPANVFVTDAGIARVLDFGVAHIHNATMTATGAVLGTPGYMSPEQVSGKKIDRRSDIYSAGTVFYELLTGQRAFHGRVDDVFDQIMQQQPAPIHALNDLLPRELSAIVQKAMAKDPEQRYQSMDEMLGHLGRFETTLAELRERVRREAEAALAKRGQRHDGGTPDDSSAPPAPSRLPQGYLELRLAVRGLTGRRDQIDDLIEEMTWVAEMSVAALDEYGEETLRRMADRVDDIRELWPGEPSVALLGRRLLHQLETRLDPPPQRPGSLDGTDSGEAARRF